MTTVGCVLGRNYFTISTKNKNPDWMEQDLFHHKDYSSHFAKFPLSYSETLVQRILSYLMEKKGTPFELAVDAGCGTGRSTRELAPYFDKVIGMDISESQINEARACSSTDNVSYSIGSVNELKLEDNTVDLITAIWAVHWFEVETFLKEVNRVLKPRGCLAMFSATTPLKVNFKDCSERLTATVNGAFNFMLNFLDEKVKLHVSNQYEEISNAIPFVEKERITDIMLTFKMTLQEIIIFIKSMIMYHTYKKESPELAEEFVRNFEQGLRDILEESSDYAIMEVSIPHFMVLACKSDPGSLPDQQ